MRLLRRGGQNLLGRRLPNRFVIAVIVALAFVLGIGAGWGSVIVAGLVARVFPMESASPGSSPSATSGPIAGIPVDLYPKLDRVMNAADRAAGLTSLAVPTRGNGVFVVVPGSSDPVGTGPTRWVRIEIEEDVPLDPDVVTSYVMSILNDAQGWGGYGRVSFGRTDGVADIRIVFTTPETAETLCPRVHEPVMIDVQPPDVPSGPVGIGASTPTPSPTPSASASASPSASPSPERVPSCAEQGIVLVSTYRWAAGITNFGDDTSMGHVYMLNHPLGHLLGEPDTTCGGSGQLAAVMVNQELDLAPCEPNGWPFPSVPEP